MPIRPPEKGNRIVLDKYYTPADLAEYCVAKTKEILGDDNITEFLEPSAGAGAFLPYLDGNYLAFDIKPEAENIEQKNYLELDLPYFKGRCVIGNPPYGDKMNLAQRFFKKSLEMGDYIAFILPISQLNNTNSLFDFDLLHSEDLGLAKYTDRKIRCCFNIYKRPKGGLNKRTKNKLEALTIYRNDKKGYLNITEFDVRICAWGSSAGKILTDGDNYSAEYKILIKEPYKKRALKLISEVDWGKRLKVITTLKIQQFHIVKLLVDNIPNIK